MKTQNQKSSLLNKFIYPAIALSVLTSGILAYAAPVKEKPVFATGCNFDPEVYAKVPIAGQQTTRAYSVIPPSYSLRQYAPYPANQGRQSSCVGWASTYAARTIVESIVLNRTDRSVSTEEAFSPSFVYNQIKHSENDCSDGALIADAMDVLAEDGGAKLKEFPYSCGATINEKSKQAASAYKIQDYNRLDPNNLIHGIKKSISENKPVVIGMDITESFMDSVGKDVWTKGGKDDKVLGGHAMCIIGYDDNKYGGAVEIQNSWGEDWGDKGYIWVKYDDLLSSVNEYFAVYGEPVAENKTALQGSMTLTQDTGDEMKAVLSPTATRDFNIVSAEGSTYRLSKNYSSGTQFRIYFTSGNAGYVYLISYGTTTKKVVPIYPFDKYSAYFDSKNTEIAIPSEDFYIQMDTNVGKDYLCILYSKEELNIKDIASQIQEKNGTFATRLKEVLKDKIVDSKNVSFEKGKISFKAKSDDKKYVVPVIVEFNHTP